MLFCSSVVPLVAGHQGGGQEKGHDMFTGRRVTGAGPANLIFRPSTLSTPAQVPQCARWCAMLSCGWGATHCAPAPPSPTTRRPGWHRCWQRWDTTCNTTQADWARRRVSGRWSVWSVCSSTTDTALQEDVRLQFRSRWGAAVCPKDWGCIPRTGVWEAGDSPHNTACDICASHWKVPWAGWGYPDKTEKVARTAQVPWWGPGWRCGTGRHCVCWSGVTTAGTVATCQGESEGTYKEHDRPPPGWGGTEVQQGHTNCSWGEASCWETEQWVYSWNQGECLHTKSCQRTQRAWLEWWRLWGDAKSSVWDPKPGHFIWCCWLSQQEQETTRTHHPRR